MRLIKSGAAGFSTYWVLRDATTHLPKTDVAITDIDTYYQKEGAAQSEKKDLEALAAADSAFSQGKGDRKSVV